VTARKVFVVFLPTFLEEKKQQWFLPFFFLSVCKTTLFMTGHIGSTSSQIKRPFLVWIYYCQLAKQHDVDE